MLLNCKLLLFRYEIKNWGLTRFHRLGTEQPSYSVLPNGCMPIVFIFQYLAGTRLTGLSPFVNG